MEGKRIEGRGGGLERTMSVVVEIEKLVAPLGDDTESIFEEGHNDEKAPNGR